MQLTLEQFHRMPQHQQAEYLWKEGDIVAERLDEMYSVLLYQLHSFYVEMSYHKDLNVIQSIQTFSNTDQLQPYLEKIDISSL